SSVLLVAGRVDAVNRDQRKHEVSDLGERVVRRRLVVDFSSRYLVDRRTRPEIARRMSRPRYTGRSSQLGWRVSAYGGVEPGLAQCDDRLTWGDVLWILTL